MQSSEDEAFPWHLGVYDAHCHPTDTVASIQYISEMKTKALTIMATRQQDQSLVAQFADKLRFDSANRDAGFIVPAFGWHPWFSHHIFDDSNSNAPGRPNKDSHYKRVITPVPEDQDFLNSLPEPKPLSTLIQETRDWLAIYPLALVGEIGLDRVFRIPGTQLLRPDYELDPALTSGSRAGRRLSPYRVEVEHQRKVLKAQLNLAGSMQRAVSVHGVAAHGVVYETLAQTWHGHENVVLSKRERKRRSAAEKLEDVEEVGAAREADTSRPYPPRLCLHSYSGAADTVRHYLQPSVPVTVFFSFSNLVNFQSQSKKTVDAIKAVPDDRILAESDLHSAGKRMDELMEDIVRTICNIKGWTLPHGVAQLAVNWRHFVFGHDQ